MLTDILVGIETLASFALVLLILLHSGRGGGLSDMFGSTVGTAAAGSTVAEKNLDRLIHARHRPREICCCEMQLGHGKPLVLV